MHAPCNQSPVPGGNVDSGDGIGVNCRRSTHLREAPHGVILGPSDESCELDKAKPRQMAPFRPVVPQDPSVAASRTVHGVDAQEGQSNDEMQVSDTLAAIRDAPFRRLRLLGTCAGRWGRVDCAFDEGIVGRVIERGPDEHSGEEEAGVRVECGWHGGEGPRELDVRGVRDPRQQSIQTGAVLTSLRSGGEKG